MIAIYLAHNAISLSSYLTIRNCLYQMAFPLLPVDIGIPCAVFSAGRGYSSPATVFFELSAEESSGDNSSDVVESSWRSMPKEMRLAQLTSHSIKFGGAIVELQRAVLHCGGEWAGSHAAVCEK
jgi:hypothetical protein